MSEEKVINTNKVVENLCRINRKPCQQNEILMTCGSQKKKKKELICERRENEGVKEREEK